jgi:pseudaminic acid cytidylyltransferase
MRYLALIPARGGSKRLPRKNILPFRGRPMIAWSILAALETDVFEKVVVTTDDDEIAAIAMAEGAEVLHRPPQLGLDSVRLLQVAQHAISTISGAFDAFCLLMPNCPLRDSSDVKRSHVDFASRSDQASVMAVFDYGWSPPTWALRQCGDYLRPIDRSNLVASRGSLLCPSGAIRWQWVDAFEAEPNWYPSRLVGHRLPWWRALDIDEHEDYEAALCVAHALDHGFSFNSSGRA